MSRGRGKRQRRFEVPDDFRWPAENEEEWCVLWPRRCVRVIRSRLVVGGVAELWSISVNGTKDYGLHKSGLTDEEAVALLRSLPNPLSRAWLLAHGFTSR